MLKYYKFPPEKYEKTHTFVVLTYEYQPVKWHVDEYKGVPRSKLGSWFFIIMPVYWIKSVSSAQQPKYSYNFLIIF